MRLWVTCAGCAAPSLSISASAICRSYSSRASKLPDIRDELGVPFQIFYGISANAHAIWSVANARRVIGYAPQDNSEERFFALIQAHMKAAGVS